jgi:hypothetical protein
MSKKDLHESRVEVIGVYCAAVEGCGHINQADDTEY